MTTDTNLDVMTRELTAYASFDELVTNRDRDDGYRPTMRPDIDPRYTVLADAYDAAQAARGSRLRAFRDAPSITPAKEKMVADMIARWREELAEMRAKGWREEGKQISNWLFGAELTLSLLDLGDLALLASKAQKVGGTDREAA